MKVNILNYVIWPLVALALSYFLRDTPFQEQTYRLDKDAFVIIKSSSFIDPTNQVRTYTIKNNTKYPITSENSLLSYTSNIRPTKIVISTGSGKTEVIPIEQSLRELFRIPVSRNFVTEDFFYITMSYPSSEIIDDNLILSIVSDEDIRYQKYDNALDLVDFTDQMQSNQELGRAIIYIESAVILWIVLLFLTRIGRWAYGKWKEDQDKKFVSPNPVDNEFIRNL